MSCDCIERMNTALKDAGENSLLVARHIVSLNPDANYRYSTVHIEVEKRDPRVRQRPKAVIPTFCPFCGGRYVEDDGDKPQADTEPLLDALKAILDLCDRLLDQGWRLDAIRSIATNAIRAAEGGEE